MEAGSGARPPAKESWEEAESPREHAPAEDFWPSHGERVDSCCMKPPSVWSFIYYGSFRKRVYPAHEGGFENLMGAGSQSAQ